MSGYGYGEKPPTEQCPYCGGICDADFVDVGVGYTQCGPYHCTSCHASEIGCHDKGRKLTDEEIAKGWYAPHSPMGSSANVDAQGRPISWQEADTLYRAKYGVASRYDERGELIK